ncbi:pilus assembly protein PilO [Brasilonema octagenarum]|uniref:Pilus assembly protein PilO n=1 Tax=Brasilonema octagenarum UFV-OR1 TaxID=417115 RepID=A0ABX1M8N8_9CYAN|nr:pilus assembly protein PilO [Brasilonema octagenarum]NMF63808.1 pilus assembly protein PilO [Brasilonema octagenarum UFV-OR1]
MTVGDDFDFVEDTQFETTSSSYPVAFGITLTPKVIGLILGVLGLAGAAYMLMNFVMPAWDNFQQQQTKQNELQQSIDQKKTYIKQIDKVQQEQALAKQQQIQVLALFANEKTLDTLLLDLNRLVESSNTQVSADAVKAKLKKYVPTGKAEPITDGSFGSLVNGKLKRSSINIEIIGTYEQTQLIFRNIERLQPLLIVKDYQSSLVPEPTTQQDKVIVRGVQATLISTSFQLQALMPLSHEEVAVVKAVKSNIK